MGNITTTNRMAILDLISQADETTEVAGLSASVTELQIEVAGLSASIAGLTGGGNLQTVTDSGNTTTNDIQLIDDAEIIFGATGGILLDNGSRLREGTIDAGFGGNKGIAQICAVGYEMKWEAGSLYIMNGDGTEIREVRYTFGVTPSSSRDITEGFLVGSRWVLDNGDIYTCSDNATSSAVWRITGIQTSTGGSATFSASASVASEVLVGNKVTYNRLTATSSEIKVSDVTSQYDTTILTDEEKLKLSLGDESYAGITYSSIEARTADGGQTTEIYIKNHDNTYTYDKLITAQTDMTDMTDGTSAATRFLSKDTFGVSVDNGTDMRSYIQGQVYPGSPNEANLFISIDDGTYDQNYTNSISLFNNAGDGGIIIYQKDETQPYSAKIEMKTDTNTVEIKSENGTGTTPATDISNIVLTPNSITNTVTDGTFTSQNYIIGDNIRNEIVGEGNTASTLVATTGIVSSIVGEGNTSTQTIAPTNIVSLVTDGTYTSQNYINSNTITSTSTDGGSTSSITQTTSDITSSSTDGTNTSSVITETTSNLISSTDGGDISAVIGVGAGGGGSITLNMIDTTIGSSLIDILPIGITTTVSDGTGTQSAIILIPNNTNISSSDGTDTSLIDMSKDVLTLQSDNLSTGKTSVLTLDPNNVGSADGSYLYTTDAIGTQSQIKFSLAGIANEYINGVNEATLRLQKDYIATQITDGTNTSGVTIEPKIFDATWTDGTKANTIYHEYNPFSELQALEMSAGNGTSLTTAVSLSQDANSSQIILEAGDRGYDGTTYSTIFLQESDLTLQKVYDGYTHKLDFYNTGAIDLFMTDGIDTSGGLYIEQNQTTISCGGTAGSTDITLKPTTISMNGIPAFDDDADASTLSPGDLYQTTGLGASPLDVAGILMIKQ